MARDTLMSARALEIYCRIEAVEGKISFGRREDRSHRTLLFYIRTFCLSQILFGENMSFAFILGGKTLM